MKNLKAVCGTVVFTLKKYSPEILMVTGIVGTGVSAVMACRATLKCHEVIEKHEEKMDAVLECIEKADVEEYTEQDAKQDRAVIAIQTGFDFIKLYGPSVTLGIASVGCILGAHNIMKKRNVALMAAYRVIEEAFSKYRDRVKTELGDGKDHHFRYGTEVVEDSEVVVDEKTGKKKTVKTERQTLNGVVGSMYARIFEEDRPDNHGGWTGSSQWCTVHDYNLSFLNAKEEWFNNLLMKKGAITLNEVYDELGFPITESGMIVGWRYKKGGDNYISFAPRNDNSWAHGRDGDPILLDFNVDGVIFDENAARAEL